jgi:hypothetical protein
VALFKLLYRNLPGRTEGNHDIRSGSVNHSTTTFDESNMRMSNLHNKELYNVYFSMRQGIYLEASSCSANQIFYTCY